MVKLRQFFETDKNIDNYCKKILCRKWQRIFLLITGRQKPMEGLFFFGIGFGADGKAIEKNCESGAYERTDNHDPEVTPCIGREEGGTEAACRVD